MVPARGDQSSHLRTTSRAGAVGFLLALKGHGTMIGHMGLSMRAEVATVTAQRFHGKWSVHIDNGKSIEHLGTVNAWSRRNAVVTAIRALAFHTFCKPELS